MAGAVVVGTVSVGAAPNAPETLMPTVVVVVTTGPLPVAEALAAGVEAAAADDDVVDEDDADDADEDAELPLEEEPQAVRVVRATSGTSRTPTATRGAMRTNNPSEDGAGAPDGNRFGLGPAEETRAD